MKVEKNINRMVERALESTEGMNRLNANPFLITRIESKLRQSKSKSNNANRAAISMLAAFVIVIVILNGTLVVLNYQQNVASSPNRFQTSINDEIDNQVNYEY